MIQMVKCPCSMASCQTWHLKGIGKFDQGSGFTFSEALKICELLNSSYQYEPSLTDNFNDVDTFSKKFGMMTSDVPRKLTKRKLIERIEFLYEELKEFVDGCGVVIMTHPTDYGQYFNEDCLVEQDFAEQADALIDLVYVAMGTAVQMGLPWQELWQDVHSANMEKVRGVKPERGHKVDCIKPPGWNPPQTEQILKLNHFDPTSEEEYDDNND